MHYFQNLYFTERGVIATICFNEEFFQRRQNRTTWTQVFPLASPSCGVISFLFSSNDNSLIGIEIYHADQCLPEYLVEHASNFRDGDHLPIKLEMEFDEILTVKFSKDQKYLSVQRFILRPPARGYASLTFTAQNKIREFCLTRCFQKFNEKHINARPVQANRVIDAVECDG